MHLHALEHVNIDGHKWDVFVRWPDGTVGRPVRLGPWDVPWGVAGSGEGPVSGGEILQESNYVALGNRRVDDSAVTGRRASTGQEPHSDAMARVPEIDIRTGSLVCRAGDGSEGRRVRRSIRRCGQLSRLAAVQPSLAGKRPCGRSAGAVHTGVSTEQCVLRCERNQLQFRAQQSAISGIRRGIGRACGRDRR